MLQSIRQEAAIDVDGLPLSHNIRRCNSYADGGNVDDDVVITGDVLDDFPHFFSVVGDVQSEMIKASKMTSE